jgi:hypothetical protein
MKVGDVNTLQPGFGEEVKLYFFDGNAGVQFLAHVVPHLLAEPCLESIGLDPEIKRNRKNNDEQKHNACRFQ